MLPGHQKVERVHGRPRGVEGHRGVTGFNIGSSDPQEGTAARPFRPVALQRCRGAKTSPWRVRKLLSVSSPFDATI